QDFSGGAARCVGSGSRRHGHGCAPSIRDYSPRLAATSYQLPVAGCPLPVARCPSPVQLTGRCRRYTRAMLTRFAPAPTGWLHLGHVLNAEYVWESGARVLLRIEDHDRERCRPEYEAGILDDLDWLRYRPDVFPTDAFRAGRCDGRQ